MQYMNYRRSKLKTIKILQGNTMINTLVISYLNKTPSLTMTRFLKEHEMAITAY